MTADNYDRRKVWTPKPRPEWVARLNDEGKVLDITSVVPLDERSLVQQAIANTGLSDFGDDEWLPHFRVLIRAMEEEARLTLMGRLMTRSDMLIYLEARLRIAEWYKRHPETNDEVIQEPVFIIGIGRSGTTILHEILAQDEQFRSVTHWEAMFPCPPPEPETYATDPRIAKADALITLPERIAPEWRAMHKMGGHLPVEDIEFLYLTFLSEIYVFCFQIPSYARYLAQQDLTYTFNWHKRILRLLQSRYRKPRWLMRAPTHLPNLPLLLKTYPDAKIIFTHRDPIMTLDSMIDVQGTIYGWRTDEPWGGGLIDDWVLVEQRAQLWNNVIGWIDDGTIPAGSFANIIYKEFEADPLAAIRLAYRDLGLPLTETAERQMERYITDRPKAKYGVHKYGSGPAPVVAEERKAYQRYQDYFGVPSEV